MKRLSVIALSVAALLISAQPVLAQGKAKAPKLDKVNGFVRGDSIKGKMFVIGAQKGPVSVDATKAKITMKGKTFDLSKLTGGSAVTVEGKLTTTGSGKTAKFKMDAVTVEVTFLRGTSVKPSIKPSTAGTKPGTNTKTKTGGGR